MGRLPGGLWGRPSKQEDEGMGLTVKKKGLTVKRVENLLRAGIPGKHTDGDVKGLMLCRSREARNSPL